MGVARQRIGVALRILISGGILTYLAVKVDWKEIWAIVHTAHVSWLLLALFLCGLTMLLGAYRWKILLRVQEIELTFSRIIQLNLIGQFFNAFLLGVTGGDVIKIYYAAQAAPEKRSAAGLSVVYDRVFGLLGLVMVGLLFTGFHYRFLTQTHDTRLAVWLFLLIAASAFGGIIFVLLLPKIRRIPALWKLEQRLPFHQTIENLSEAFQRYARSGETNLIALGISVTIHLILFGMMFCTATSLGIPVTFWTLAAIAAIVNVLIAIPISFSGLGFREGLFVIFLGLVNVRTEQAFAFSLLGFALNLFWSGIGGIAYMRYQKPTLNLVPQAVTEVT